MGKEDELGKREIWYVLNLHTQKLIGSCGSQKAANNQAEKRMHYDGCTYAVARGLTFHQPDGMVLCFHKKLTSNLPVEGKEFKFELGQKVHLPGDERVLTIVGRRKWNPGEVYTAKWSEGDTSEFRGHELEAVE